MFQTLWVHKETQFEGRWVRETESCPGPGGRGVPVLPTPLGLRPSVGASPAECLLPWGPGSHVPEDISLSLPNGSARKALRTDCLQQQMKQRGLSEVRTSHSHAAAGGRAGSLGRHLCIALLPSASPPVTRVQGPGELLSVSLTSASAKWVIIPPPPGVVRTEGDVMGRSAWQCALPPSLRGGQAFPSRAGGAAATLKGRLQDEPPAPTLPS